jgi:hypothetical protein
VERDSSSDRRITCARRSAGVRGAPLVCEALRSLRQAKKGNVLLGLVPELETHDVPMVPPPDASIPENDCHSPIGRQWASFRPSGFVASIPICDPSPIVASVFSTSRTRRTVDDSESGLCRPL